MRCIAALVKLLQGSSNCKHCVYQLVFEGTLPIMNAPGNFKPLSRVQVCLLASDDARMGNDRPRISEEHKTMLLNMPVATSKV